MEGWIKLHRQIIENEFYFSEKFNKVQAWIDLLLLATHKERTVCIRGIEIILKPGQLCYSQKSLAARWNWNVKTVERYLNSLKKREMVDTKKTNITTIISIKNWFLYQTDGEQNTYQKGQQKDTKREANKNDENEKNDKEVRASLFAEKVYSNNGFQKEDLAEFIEHWTESGENSKKLRFEMEKVFDISRRLKTWMRNKEKWGVRQRSKEHLDDF